MSICSSITGASSAIAAASAGDRAPSGVARTAGLVLLLVDRDPGRRPPGTSRSARAADTRRRRGRAGSRRATCRTPRPPPRRPRRTQLRSSSFASCIHFGASGDRQRVGHRPQRGQRGERGLRSPGRTRRRRAPRADRRRAGPLRRRPRRSSPRAHRPRPRGDPAPSPRPWASSTPDLVQPVEQGTELEGREQPPHLVAGSHSPITQSWGPMSSGEVGDDPRQLLVQGQLRGRRQHVVLQLARAARPRARATPRPSRTPGSASWRSSPPRPGTPGMLSEGSPFSATYSRYFDGGTPNRSSTPASSYRTMSEIPRRLNITCDARAHQLEEVAVGGDDHRVDALLGAPARRGCRWRRRPRGRRPRTIGIAKRVEHLVDQARAAT